jgi:hypothetical protein
VSAERADSAMCVNLMNDVPNPVEGIANNEHNRQPEAENTEYGEYDHCPGFKAPGFLVSEIRGEGQIKSRDRNEKQSKKDLLSFCRK